MMNLDLKRIDMGYTGNTERSTLKVLPVGHETGQGQRVVVGDASGVLQSFYCHKDSLMQVFKGVPGHRKINCVVTGMGASQRDKAFVAEGSVIKGYDAKGSQFFRFTTPITEDIKHICVAGTCLFAFTDMSVTTFDETHERCCYTAPESISTATIAPLASAETWWPILACNDRTLKVLNDTKVVQEIQLNSAPTAVVYCPMSRDVLNQHPTRKEVFVGLADGTLHQLFLDSSTHHFATALTPPASEHAAAITQIYSGFDSANDGLDDVVVGREGGKVEIYHMDAFGQLVKCWDMNLSQSISSICGGHITSPHHDDYIVHTFGGALVVFSNGTGKAPKPPPAAAAANAAAEQATDALQAAERALAEKKAAVAGVEKELAALNAELTAKRKQMFQRSASFVSSNQLLPLKHSFQFDAQRGVFCLALEATVPIFCVAVVATVHAEFLELQGSVVILTVSDPPPNSTARCLATYRCHDSMPRVMVNLRIQEGQTGSISAYVISRGTAKTSSVVSYPVMTLCLHHRIRELDAGRALGTLEITGDFRSVDMHAWLLEILPDTPQQRQGGDAPAAVVYESAVLRSQLVVTYRDGAARFQSDSPGTLALLRTALTKHANNSQTRIRTVTQLDKACMAAFIRRIFPLLQEQQQRGHRAQLVKGLQQACAQEADTSFLTEDMRKLLKEPNDPQNEAAGGGAKAPQASLASLLKQLALGHAEWVKFLGRTASAADAAALERAALDRSTTAPALTEMVTAA